MQLNSGRHFFYVFLICFLSFEVISRQNSKQRFRDFLKGMLGDWPLMGASDVALQSPNLTYLCCDYHGDIPGKCDDDVGDRLPHLHTSPGGVTVDVGQVDEHVATLWWALAQQTARIARRTDAETGESDTESQQRNLAANSSPAETLDESSTWNSYMTSLWPSRASHCS